MYRTAMGLLVVLATVGAVRAQDRIYTHQTDGVQVQLFLPEGVETYRGLLLHVANYRLSPDNRWAELARELEFGHVVMQMDMRRNQRPRILFNALEASLPVLAERSGQPELPRLPLVGLGHSAGGMVVNVLSNIPQRTLTAAIDCSWVARTESILGLRNTPLLFTLGAVPDGFNMIPAIAEHFEPARKDGWLYGLGFEWGKAHTFGNAAGVFVPWIKSVARMRLPQEPPAPGEPVRLREIRQEDGWLGDRSNWDTRLATIAPWREYAGDRSAAVWLPDRAAAYLWRAYQTKDSPVHLQARSAGGASLGEFRPRREFQMTAAFEEAIELGVATAGDDLPLAHVRYYNGDRLLGESSSAPWSVTWTDAPRGVHAIFAHYRTTDGAEGVTNPGLIIVRRSVEVQRVEQP